MGGVLGLCREESGRGGGYGVKLVAEPVELIEGSYVRVNPDGRFYTNVGGPFSYSSSILEVGVEKHTMS